MAEVMLADHGDALGLPADDEPWWEWLERTARWLRLAMLSRRDGARVFAGTTLPAERTFLRMLDLVVSVLRTAGFPAADALLMGGWVLALSPGNTIGPVDARSSADCQSGGSGVVRQLTGSTESPAPALTTAAIPASIAAIARSSLYGVVVGMARPRVGARQRGDGRGQVRPDPLVALHSPIYDQDWLGGLTPEALVDVRLDRRVDKAVLDV
jgi:tetracycline repressor-like protein